MAYRFLLPVKDVHGQPDEPEGHDAVRHRPADVVGVGADDDVADDQVTDVEHEEEDRRGQRSLEQSGHDESQQDAQGAVNQGFGPDGPQGDLENKESYEIKQIKKKFINIKMITSLHD